MSPSAGARCRAGRDPARPVCSPAPVSRPHSRSRSISTVPDPRTRATKPLADAALQDHDRRADGARRAVRAGPKCDREGFSSSRLTPPNAPGRIRTCDPSGGLATSTRSFRSRGYPLGSVADGAAPPRYCSRAQSRPRRRGSCYGGPADARIATTSFGPKQAARSGARGRAAWNPEDLTERLEHLLLALADALTSDRFRGRRQSCRVVGPPSSGVRLTLPAPRAGRSEISGVGV
jgi:hypothetical protein